MIWCNKHSERVGVAINKWWTRHLEIDEGYIPVGPKGCNYLSRFVTYRSNNNSNYLCLTRVEYLTDKTYCRFWSCRFGAVGLNCPQYCASVRCGLLPECDEEVHDLFWGLTWGCPNLLFQVARKSTGHTNSMDWNEPWSKTPSTCKIFSGRL